MKRFLTGNYWFVVIGLVFLLVGIFLPESVKNEDGSTMKYPLIGFGVIWLLIFAVWIGFQRIKEGRIKKAITDGKQGRATVLQLVDTGTRINHALRVKLQLRMEFEGYQPYDVWKKITLPEVRIPQVQPGKIIVVYADPEDPQNTKKLAIAL